MSIKKKETKTIKVSLAPGDKALIEEVAEDLGISETEVLRKGLKLMAAYKKAKLSQSSIIIENEKEKTRQELLIL